MRSLVKENDINKKGLFSGDGTRLTIDGKFASLLGYGVFVLAE